MRFQGIKTSSKGLPLDSHFDEFSEWRSWRMQNPDTPEILVVHLQSSAESILADVIGPMGGHGHTVGVLFVTAERYAGVAQDVRQGLERKYPGQVHFLSYPVQNLRKGEPCQQDIRQRFTSFHAIICTLKETAEIPWHLLEPPPWPENIVAVYLALVAKERGTDVLETAITASVWQVADDQIQEIIGRYGEKDTVWDGFDFVNRAENSVKLESLKTVLSMIAEKQST